VSGGVARAPVGASTAKVAAMPMTMSVRIDRPRSRLDIGASPRTEPPIAVVGRVASAWSDVTCPRPFCVAWDVASTPRPRAWEAPSDALDGRSYSSEGMDTDRCCPWMTAVDRCVGHVGGTAGEDDRTGSLAATVTSSAGGRAPS
jgi:hypothetical protein